MTTESLIPEPETPALPEGTDPEEKKRRRTIIAIIAVALLLLALLGALLWYLLTGKPVSQIPVLDLPVPPAYSTSFYDVEQPLGVALDEKNNRIYVSQSGGDQRVAVYTFDGQPSGELFPPGPKARPHVPVYVAVNPLNSEVYVSDRAAATVYVYDVAGTFLREFKPNGVKKWSPLGLTFDKDGNLYVTDVTDGDSSVYKLNVDGTVLLQMGQDDALSFPNGVAVRDDGKIFVTDSNNGRVMVYNADGTSAGAIPRGQGDATLGLPRGATFDDRGRLYIVDTVNQAVKVFKPEDNGLASFWYMFGEEGIGDGQFLYPNGVATDSQGHVYITDRENNRLQVWTYR